MTVWEFGDILYRFNFGEPYDINLELNTYLLSVGLNKPRATVDSRLRTIEHIHTSDRRTLRTLVSLS
jgi:hypothetical protein